MLAHLQVVLELELSQPRRAPQESHGMDANACAAIGLEAGCARLKSPRSEIIVYILSSPI